jgi:chromosome segregation ATPase
MACNLVKKGVVGAALGVTALALLFGGRAPSYVKTAFHRVRHDARRAVPMDYEIQRVRDEVNRLDPAMLDSHENIVRAQVDLEELQREIVASRDNLDREKREMLALADRVKSGEYRVGGNTYSAEEVKADLARRFDRYSYGKKAVEQREQIVKTRKQAVAAARDQLVKMAAQKQILIARIEAMEAKLKQVEATRAGDEFNFDDSPLARARQDVTELEKRVEVMSRIAAERGMITDKSVPVTVETNRDVVREIDAEFGPDAKGTSRPADKDL